MFDIGPQYYLPIYYIVVAIFSFLAFTQYENYADNRLDVERDEPIMGIVLFTVLMAIFIGLRPISGLYFVDMSTYEAVYQVLRPQTFVFFTGSDVNIVFDNLFAFMATHGVPSKYFYLLMAVIYFTGISVSCCILFPKDKFVAILVYLTAFSTYAYGVNGIKAGAAASLFLIGLTLYERRHWFWMILFMLLAWGMHHAMIVPIVAFVACQIVREPKVYMAFWVVCFFLSLFHVTFFQELFASFTDEKGAEYLMGSGGHVRSDLFGGFRIDFVLYSIVPMVVGLIAIEKKKIESQKYNFLLNLYTLTNAVWLLCMYSDYTNRIAYLSWFLYPIVLIYPFLNEEWEGNKYKTFQWVVYGHLAFNLVMVFIYW